MNKQRVFCVALASVAILGAGCQPRSARAQFESGQKTTTSPAPAPLAAPPMLPGTPDVATLVSKVKPAVVNVTVTQAKTQRRDGMPFGFGPFGGFNPFGRQGPDDNERPQKQRGLGSGFIIDSAGHVVTNAHVVEDASSVRVKLSDEREYDAKVKGKDERLDLALLELQGAKDLPFVSLGSSEQLRVGEYVVAIGNPFGLGDTVTMGIVSAKSRAIGAGPYDDFIQTDASINPGNSGGPLFNLTGQVVGINTAISATGQGIGFAIPIDDVKDVLPQLLSTGHVARGRLGVLIQSVDPALGKALGMDRARGALVGEVEPGGPADKAGLKAGDVIVSVNQTPINHGQELPRLVARHQPGGKVSLTVMRDQATRTVDVTLDTLKDETTASKPQASPNRPELGIELGEPQGGGVLVQRVAPGSKAEDLLEPGDVILEINRTPVARGSEASKLLKSAPAGEPVLLKIKREGKTRFVAIESDKK